MKKYTEADVPEYFIKLHQRKNNQWVVAGYVCPDCDVLYKGLRAEIFRHENICKGKSKRSLEE